MSKKTEIRQKNELAKRKYLVWYKGAEGMSELTIRAVEKAIEKYEDCTQNEDFAMYSLKRAEIFKKYLETNLGKRSGRALNIKSRYAILRHVRNYFAWLSSQPGYKSKIKTSDIAYLQLSKEENRQAIAPSEPKYPNLDQVKLLCSFPVVTEIDKRDRALIAFTALTGMRDRAVITLPIGCYDPLDHVVKQLPSKGVETKFKKEIYTTLLPIDQTLYDYFNDWYTYLRSECRFVDTEPLFPSTEIGLISPEHHAYEVKGVSRQFWADAGPMRKIFRDRCNQMGIEYFYPHTFRHFVTNLAEQYISTPEQMKALSQNLGHENIATTYRAYGAITTKKVNEIVRGIDFSQSVVNRQTTDIARQVLELIKAQNISVK